jgi:hypothetical protein
MLEEKVASFGAGLAGPVLAAWPVTRTGSWQSARWMNCTFAGLGGLLSLHLSERRLGITLGRPRPIRQPDRAATSHCLPLPGRLAAHSYSSDSQGMPGRPGHGDARTRPSEGRG